MESFTLDLDGSAEEKECEGRTRDTATNKTSARGQHTRRVLQSIGFILSGIVGTFETVVVVQY